jgi:HNH endonuclease
LHSNPVGPGLEKDQARFWSKVSLPNEDGCMIFAGAPRDRKRSRYGGFWVTGRTVRAHIYSYVLAYGAVPLGLVVDHVRANGCRTTLCVAPNHLEAVTQEENIRRGDTGGFHRRKTHCPRWHLYDEANTYRNPKGYRRCRTCRGY